MRDRGVKHTASSITPLITLYGKTRDYDKADGLFRMMRETGIERSFSNYTSLMKCYGKDAAKVSDLNVQMIEDGVNPNMYTYSTMIDAFAKNGQIEKAIEVFDSIMKDGVRPDVFVYTSMIDAFAKNGQIEKAIEVFDSIMKDGVRPDVFVYTSMIDAFAKNGQIEKAIEVFDSIMKDGVRPDVFVYTSMIDAYAKNGQIEKAIEVFDSIMKDGVRPDVFVYTSMIDAYAKNGQIEKAIEQFDLMKDDGMRPDEVTFGALLNCFAKTGKPLNELLDLVKAMRESSIEFDIHVWSSIMEGFSRAEDEKDQKKALSIWKYLSGQISHESLGIDLPVKASHVLPNVVTLSIAIDACKIGRFEKEAHKAWLYGQENDGIALESNVLTSYVECLVSFGERGADRVVGLITSEKLKNDRRSNNTNSISTSITFSAISLCFSFSLSG
jgi:pentatricopeptide repeat protein